MHDDMTESIKSYTLRRIADTGTDRVYAGDRDDLSSRIADIWAERLDPHDAEIMEALEEVAEDHSVVPADPYDENDPYIVLRYEIFQDWCTDVLITSLRRLAVQILSSTEGV